MSRQVQETASTEMLKKQKIVYQLLWHVDQPEMVPEFYKVGKDYRMESNFGGYKREDYVKEFFDIYKRGMLPRGEIFSVFYPTLLDQAIALFRVFYYAKNFDTLFKTAAWARIYVNEGLFVYAFSVAVMHHPETQRIRVPAHHEMYPYLFFNDEAIRKAYDARIYPDSTKVSTDDSSVIVHTKRFNPWAGKEWNKLSYFTEDVSMNDVQYYAHLAHPFWMSTEEYGAISPIRGEIFFWTYRMQLARYYMERLSNGFGEIEDFDWSYPIPYGYFPNSSYHNGVSLPHREICADIPSHNYKWLKALRDYEYRISTAIDLGHAFDTKGTTVPFRTPQGIQTLGNMVEGNADSVNHSLYGSYDRVARSVLGFSPAPRSMYKVFPSMMQQYGLDQRDPMFWSMAKNIWRYYEQFMSKLPKWTFEELNFSGVKIESMNVERVTTYFEYKDYWISGAMKMHKPEDKTTIKARQYRLNHKPYTYTVTVNSDKATKGTIRIFLGPKYNVYHEEIDITENWKHFMLLDEWMVNLKTGTNKFERNSTQAFMTVPEEVDGDSFYKKIVNALEGKGTYEIPKNLYGFSQRMTIPKGTTEGFPYQFFVFISPYNGETVYHSKSPMLEEKDLLTAPMGYPLDRPVFFNFTNLPNAYFKEFKVYHIEDKEMNMTF